MKIQDDVDLKNLSKPDLLKILAGSTNAGSPFTAEEIEAVKGEIALRPEPAPASTPRQPPPKRETAAEAKARAKAEAELLEEDDDKDDGKDEDGDD